MNDAQRMRERMRLLLRQVSQISAENEQLKETIKDRDQTILLLLLAINNPVLHSSEMSEEEGSSLAELDPFQDLLLPDDPSPIPEDANSILLAAMKKLTSK